MYNIVYFLDYATGFGGAANTLLQQAILMKNAGHRIMIFISDYYGKDINNKLGVIGTDQGISFVSATYQVASQPEDIDIICLCENYENVKGIIRKLEPDIIHSVQLNPMAELISRELGIPHIMNIYPLHPDFFSVDYMDIFPHYHICDSWYWAEKWKYYLNTDSVCIRTVVNVKKDGYPKISQSAVTRYICVGSVYEGKNQLGVIKAFQLALQKGIQGELTIFGNVYESYAKKCIQYIKDNRLSDCITMHGFCQDMEEEYNKADVLICGSTRESFPNVISEAMAYGVIVISTPVAGVPEEIRDHYNGYVSDGYTEEAICKKILEFEAEKKTQIYKSIVQNAKYTFIKNHSPQAVLPQLLNCYQHVLEDGRRKSKVDIEDIRKTFENWEQLFFQNYEYFSKPEIVALKLWYLYHVKEKIERICRNDTRFYIWGTGHFAFIVKEILDVFFPEIALWGFIDSYNKEPFLSYQTYQTDKVLREDNVVILVAVYNGQEQVIKELEKYHKVNNENYFIFCPRKW